jgi:predicted AlkP superfamily pyrophosphatase or phosphodiesterase
MLGGFSRKRVARALLVAFACAACAPAPALSAKASADRSERAPAPKIERIAPARPKLIVQITIDQLRADQLLRFASRFGSGGFRRFLENGTYYGVAHYAHGPTETAVGHATLFTGALPQTHGIVGNEWYDSKAKRRRFAVEDPAHHWLDHDTPSDGGTSPRAMRVPTIGDEMVLASGGRALVHAISIKDRGAILPAGFAGKAFWYDERSGDFVTSDYHFDKTPEFLRVFNATRPSDRYRLLAWDLLRPREQYERRELDDRAFEKSYKTLGRTLPHRFDGGPPETLYAMLKRTPFADELTLELAKALLEHSALGRDDVTDLLAISFSATDYISHVFGPESLEAEDNLLRVDATLARLFEHLLTRVTEAELLVVLSSDHGGCESPESLHALGVDADHHEPVALLARLNDALEKRFGKRARFVVDFSNPTLWLDEAAIAARSLSLELVERVLTECVLAEQGFAYAITKTDLARGSIPRGPVYDRIANAFDRERTGNVYVVPKPGWLLATDPKSLTSMHGTPWSFDTHVPIAFYGNAVRAQHVLRPVDPRDIAPTLAMLLSIEAPRGASGSVLREILER